MSKLRSSNVPPPTPMPASGASTQHVPLGGVAMKRLGSGGGEIMYICTYCLGLIAVASRAPSALSIRSRDSPVPRVDTSVPGTPRAGGKMHLFRTTNKCMSNHITAAPPLSRTPSTNTVTQSRHFLPPSPRQAVQRSFRTSNPPLPRKLDTATLPATNETTTSISSPASSSSSDSSSSDSETAAVKRSQMFRRPPPFNQHKIKKSTLSNVDDLDDESSDDGDSPTFLSFAKPPTTAPPRTNEDPGATLRDVAAKAEARNATAASQREKPTVDSLREGEQSSPGSPAYAGKGKGKAPVLTRMESSASSTNSAPVSAAQGHKQRLDALSPRHRAELARLSPRRRATSGKGGDPGSDGTPSMGSSFSDLDGKLPLCSQSCAVSFVVRRNSEIGDEYPLAHDEP
jgi:hypothetical protein